MRLIIAMLAALTSLTLCACGARNIRPGETPNSLEGIAYIRVILSGASEVMIGIQTKGDRFWPQKARVDATEGDHIYAVIMAQGEYDIGGIFFEGKSSKWPDPSFCPSYKVVEGKSIYIGTLELNIELFHWYKNIFSQKYQIRCSNSSSDAADALKMYENAYGLRDPVSSGIPLDPSR